MSDPLHLRLAGVTRLALARSAGPKDVFVFDPHRLALPCWALALEEANLPGPATLVTFDRHFDLVAPKVDVPDRTAGVRALDELARWSLDVRNYDHVVAAMEAGLVGDVIAIARANPRGAIEGTTFRGRHGRDHRLVRSPTLARIVEQWDDRAGLGADTRAVLANDAPVLLDVDLDCFTSPSDADPTTVLPWPREIVRDFLLPHRPFWDAVLPRARCLTLAREPHHCGGLLAGGRLFETVATVLFEELLGAELP